MNGNPTAAQKRFHDNLRETGCIICGSAPLIHHIKGSRMKLKGVKGAGEWYVLPVCHDHHSPYSERISIHKNRSEFERTYTTQKINPL